MPSGAGGGRGGLRAVRVAVLAACALSCGRAARAVTVSAEEVRAVAESYVRERLPEGATGVVLDFRRVPEPATLPSQSARCEVAGRPRVMWTGPTGLPVRIVGSRGEVQTQLLSVVVTAEIRSLHTLHPIEAGAPVLTGDVTGTAKALALTPEGAILDTAELAGRTAARRIPAGALLQRTHLTSPLLVRGGDRVRLVAVRGALVVEAEGKALGPGRFGDTIKVRNLASQRVVEARVTGERLVEALGGE